MSTVLPIRDKDDDGTGQPAQPKRGITWIDLADKEQQDATAKKVPLVTNLSEKDEMADLIY